MNTNDVKQNTIFPMQSKSEKIYKFNTLGAHKNVIFENYLLTGV
jgi:hypothetical protein